MDDAQTQKPSHRQEIEPGYFLVVSDMHIGHRDSCFDKKEIRDTFKSARKSAKHLILNGDIFELTSKTHAPPEARARAIEDAIDTLREWIADYPEQKIHYVLGNHENLPGFRNALKDLKAEYPQTFSWHSEALVLGDMLFTHGDLQSRDLIDGNRPLLNEKGPLNLHPDRGVPDTDTAIQKIHDHLTKHASRGTEIEEDMVTVHRPQDRMHASLNGKEEILTNEIFSNINHIFSGHTHKKYTNEECEGKSYHNTGAPIRQEDHSVEKLGFIAGEIDVDGHASKIINYQDAQDQGVQKGFREKLENSLIEAAKDAVSKQR